jgi:hypothetical protein
LTRRPAAILSFNAEPFLYALINAHWAVKRKQAGQGLSAVLDRITGSVTRPTPERLPYYFCHGILPIPGQRLRWPKATKKLVFSETAYLSLANASYSWQATAFASAATTSSLVFLGMSMTDPNLRRWLGWQHQTRLEEIGDLGQTVEAATPHYWISRDPGSDSERAWLEALVPSCASQRNDG